MDINPQAVRSHEFGTARRGLDPGQVHAFLAEVADELERAQNHATAMEARARAAVQRIQELTTASPDDETVPLSAPTAEAETISRTLLLAQRTADTTVAEARAEAERLVARADEEATGLLDAAREERAQLVEAAREDAQREGEGQRARLREEADALEHRRDALRDDVDHLEQFLVAQRERMRDTATTLLDLTERIPGGLGHVAGPLLSSVDAATEAERTDEAGAARADEADDVPDGGTASPDGSAEEPAPDTAHAAGTGDALDTADTVTWRPTAGETAGGTAGDTAGESSVAPGDPTPVGGADDLFGSAESAGGRRAERSDERG